MLTEIIIKEGGSSRFSQNMFRAFLGEESLERFRKQTEAKISDILMESVAAVVIPALQREIEGEKIDFKENLKDSFKVVKLNQYSVEVRSTVDYVQMVDEGTEERDVDQEEFTRLIEWAAMKIISPDPVQTAVEVAEKIEREGSAAHPFVGAALETAEQPLIDLIQREVAKAIG
jgi:hypothetical protein